MAVVVLVVLGSGIYVWLRDRDVTPPVPGQQRCVATSGQSSVSLTFDQAELSSIIVGVSVRRGLPARAASIAMATAYQETGIRNLGSGDRDSVGLFQQRPSQGWGSKARLQDPYYATGKFYDALVKVKNWETDAINDVAQKVQRSGYPEAYRDHESDGRVLASALSGQSPGGLSCLDRSGRAGRAPQLAGALKKTFGSVEVGLAGQVVTVRAKSSSLAWAYASFAVANVRPYGLVSADVDGRSWTTNSIELPAWTSGPPTGDNNVVTLTVR